MSIDLARYREALQEFTGVAANAFAGETLEFTVEGIQSVAVTLDGAAETARVVSVVDHASKELSQSLLTRLLEFNFPNDATAGAILCATAGGDSLALVNIFPLASIAPRALASIAIGQGRAALRMSRWIAAQEIADA